MKIKHTSSANKPHSCSYQIMQLLPLKMVAMFHHITTSTMKTMLLGIILPSKSRM
jgi:hypothetical protein